MAAKKKTGPKRKKQDVEEHEVIEDVEMVEEIPEAKESDGEDEENVSEDERPKSKAKGKTKPASKKRVAGGKIRPFDVDMDEAEVETPSKKGRGRPKKGGKTSPELELEEEDVENGDESSKPLASAKKGKGRPRKSGKPEIVEDDIQSDYDVNETPSKRGKGRPKKAVNVSSDIDEEEEEDDTTSKKGKVIPKSDKRKAGAKDSQKGKRGRPSSSKQSDEGSEEEEDEKEYEVDRILDVQFLRNGKREFLIKWKGYSKDDSTWEPESHLDCTELLEAFMAKVEYDDVSRPRRLSRRPSTIKATRISESRNIDLLLNRVKEGRIDKTIKRSSVSSTRSTTLRQVQNINRLTQNGTISSSVTDSVNVRHNKQRSTKRGILRAAVLSCGMVASLSAALLYSSTNASLSWDNISLQAQELITGLKDKFGDYYQQSMDTVDTL